MLTTAIWLTNHRLDSFKFNKILEVAHVGGFWLYFVKFEICCLFNSSLG
jgi:hypothetical protein